MTASTVHLRLFASARAATGLAELTLRLPAGATIAQALAELSPAPGQPLGQVLARCSFLLNAVATTDRSTELSEGDRLDVLPPFAGG
ncbi:MAG: Molybdenum cofactor biosynthesis protein MoaD [Microbacteriaceae bacterium]|jgi:molybdopterin synthase sulfur carrier subunit|nr:Molybdenum cofactor biosynthesis protein MoaD [Microbacteriaceae bacterium]HEV7956391.1 MoaD/ThiS family protein [Marisediminicola sp.]